MQDILRKIITAGDTAIFDMDGTLIDSMFIWQNVDERFLRSKGVEPEAGLGDKLFVMSMEEATEYLRVTYRLNMTREEIIQEIIQMVREEYFFHVPAKTGVEHVLKQLKAAGFHLLLATSCEPVLMKGCMKRLGLWDYFEKAFTCAEVGAGKNKPDIYLSAARYAGSTPKKTWVFEDALHAAQTAKKAGFLVAGVYDVFSERMQEELKKLSDIYISNFEEIIGG